MSVANGIFELKFADPRHKVLLDAIRKRWRFSWQKMSQQYVKWGRMEDEFVAYMPAKAADITRDNGRKQDGKPAYTTVFVPHAYAQLLAAHTYWTSVFLSRSPIMQFTGRHGEAEMSVQALEALIDYQVNIGGMLVPLYIWLLDPGKYGFGVVGVSWEEEVSRITQISMEPRNIMGIPLPGTERRVKRSQDIMGYQGNKLFNVRPYDFFPDPRFPIAQFQRGEFCGRYFEGGLNGILKRENAGLYYNVAELKKTRPSEFLRNLGSPRVELPNASSNLSSSGSWETTGGSGGIGGSSEDPLDFYGILEFTWELVPSKWGLGTGNVPEKWVFTVGNDAVILSAQPLGYYHDKFPFQVLEYEIEGYGMFKRSMLEQLKPLNDVLTWLFNSHFYNVRKALNDQFVIDPSRIMMKDALDPEPGRMMRLKPTAYGSDPKTAIAQLSVVDVTQNHVRDAAFVMDLMSRLSGVNDNIMGMINSGGRKSATEVRTSSSFGVNRLKTNSEFYSAQGFSPLAQMLLQNTQQKYDQDKQFRIAGSLFQDAKPYMNVTAESIAGFYDYIPVDGTMPVDRYAMAALWQQLMGQMAQMPDVLMQYDFGKIFTYVAGLAGVKNLSQFKVQIAPAERLQELAQQGNVIRLGGGGGRSQSRSRGGSGGSAPNSPPVGQVAGMGPSG